MKTVCILIIAILPLFLIGKEKMKPQHFPGGIISLNNDTIPAEIIFESILKSQSQVKFIDAGGKKKVFKPQTIKGFFVTTKSKKLYFESRNDIRISVFPSKKGNFVLRISNDIYPLYYFVTSRMKNIGIETQMIQIPNYLIRMDNRWHHFNEHNFTDCTKIFSDDAALVKAIKNGQYKFENFPEIVARYCKSIESLN